MRKCLLLTTATFLISFIASAQIGKGSVLLGGNISGYFNKYKSSNSNYNPDHNGFSVSPSVGIATKENNVWGITGNYDINTNSTSSPGQYQSTAFGAGIFYRKHITLGKGFYLFGHASAGYSKYKSNLNEDGILRDRTETTNQSIGINAHPGITYTVSNRMHLEVGLNSLLYLGYDNEKNIRTSPSGESNYTRKSFSLRTNLSSANPLSVGFRFVLGK